MPSLLRPKGGKEGDPTRTNKARIRHGISRRKSTEAEPDDTNYEVRECGVR